MSQEDSHISLSLLNQLVKEVVQGNFIEEVWLVAEVAELNTAASGHCYLELIEKKEEKIIARIKANIWSFQYQKIANRFYSSTGKVLEKGMKILLLASVNFHELYGISLVVKNIDPTYTMGELAKNRQDIIKRLKKEGLFDVNKAIELELVPKRIAVISSETAAGYEDFINQLNTNQKAYSFETTLFASVMQGDLVEQALLNALNKILVEVNDFDVVTIIRGGGASLDLTAFDNYEIAKKIANFPLPVIVGIGHERDSTIVDLVAHTSLKTPTAVASFFIKQFEEFEDYMNELRDSLVYLVKEKLFSEQRKTTEYRSNFASLCQSYLAIKNKENIEIKSNINRETKLLLSRTKQIITTHNHKVKSSFKSIAVREQQYLVVAKSRLLTTTRSFVQKKQNLHQSKGQLIKLLDPINVLKRGYAMLLKNDKEYIKSKSQLEVDEEIKIVLKDGNVQVKIKKL